MIANQQRIHSHYDNLKVARDAPEEVIRAAYRTLSQKFHPDRNPGDADAARIMSLVNQAYEVLSDPAKRAKHDAWIREQELRATQRPAEAPRQSPPPRPQTRPPERSRDHASRVPPEPPRAPLKSESTTTAWAIVIAIVVIGWYFADKSAPPKVPPRPVAAAKPVAPPKPAYTRPPTAPNGTAWPQHAGYVSGYPIANRGGYSTLSIDNGQGDSDVYVKVVDLDAPQPTIVRTAFIPARATLTLESFSAGRYDVRYRDLNSGRYFQTPEFELEQRATAEGTSYSTVTMTLYKVRQGNMRTSEIDAAQFE